MLCIQKNRILIKHYQLIITLESTIFECKMNNVMHQVDVNEKV